jgi:hypothetical protein
MLYNQAPIMWRSKMQKTTALSTAEAEYYSASTAGSDVLYPTKRGRDSNRHLSSSTICDGVYFVWYAMSRSALQHLSTGQDSVSQAHSLSPTISLEVRQLWNSCRNTVAHAGPTAHTS